VVPVVVKAGRAPGGVAGAPRERAVTEIPGAVAAQAPGWIEPDPFAVNIPALADGIVKEVLILEGQHVAEGEVVARLIDDDARLQLARAEADLREMMAEQIIAEAELKEARMNWDNRTELNRAVGVAEATLEEVRAELARLPLEVDAQSAKLAELRDDLSRKEELVAKRAVAEGDVAQLRHRV
jgi:HlyD family secretion protein